MKYCYIPIGGIFILILLVVPSVTTITRNNDDKIICCRDQIIDKKHIYDCYSRTIITHDNNTKLITSLNVTTTSSFITIKRNTPITLSDGIMNSSWPMYCHDLHHTGRSPCDTLNNSGTMKWSFRTNNYSLYGSSVIDTNGIIYLGSGDFFALYPNGTKKWQYEINGRCESCPSLDENGTIYFGTSIGDPNYFYAIYPNGTIKWRYWIGGGTDIKSSPIIGSDGTIFFGCGQSIVALYSNGTLRWQYSTNHLVYSSPAIGDDGTVYCGCHDTYLYALYPNNGTLKWKFSTGDWIRVSPCIADDETIYCVSTDGYLYAIYPNGTMKWRTWVEAGTSPTIGQDGTIYAGWSKLYAINPTNGSVKWIYDPGGTIQGGTPCTSADGTIYFGTSSGGNLIAVNPNGTEKWRVHIGGCESAPAIGEDGTIYIGGSDSNGRGYLYAFGRGSLKAEANGPYNGYAYVPLQLTGTIFGGIPPYTHHWDFGDGQTSDKQNPTHNYTNIGNYMATFTVVDSEGNSSNDTATVTIVHAHPSVTITKPVEALYIANIKILPDIPIPIIIGRITVCVDALQQPFGINRVEFYINNALMSTDTSAPYQWTWTKRSLFQIAEIEVVAYDNTQQSSQTYIQVWRFF